VVFWLRFRAQQGIERGFPYFRLRQGGLQGVEQ